MSFKHHSCHQFGQFSKQSARYTLIVTLFCAASVSAFLPRENRVDKTVPAPRLSLMARSAGCFGSKHSELNKVTFLVKHAAPSSTTRCVRGSTVTMAKVTPLSDRISTCTGVFNFTPRSLACERRYSENLTCSRLIHRVSIAFTTTPSFEDFLPTDPWRGSLS